ncbi:VMAP-C domain-containing protein [Streptomyces zaomyceticus]|uniref:VMAP-C domain-containing protein n=1 Tax=Streptomyces zaomyceticus TaxID=68286 RepID=UPI00379ACC11
MSWFSRPATPVSHAALLREGDRRAAGAAALLSPNHLLTCAHVVNDAVGRDLLCAERPTDEVLRIAFHGSGRASLYGRARLSVWVAPEPRSGDVVWDGDLAVLELEETAPEWATPVVWRDMTEGLELRAWHGGGVGITYADTVAGFRDGPGCYLDGSLTGAAIGPGYSGGPLRVKSDRTVAGLVIAQVMPGQDPLRAQETVRRSWAVPWQTVRERLTRAGAHDILAGCEVVAPDHLACTGASEDSVRQMVPLLRALLDDTARRADHCRHLAAGLGLETPSGGEQPAPTLDELATLLLTEERALATLTESLTPVIGGHGDNRTTLNGLLALGRVEPAVRLLSVTEHQQLHTALLRVARHEPDLIPGAAQEALRLLELPEALTRSPRLAVKDVDAVVRSLEEYPDGRDATTGSLPVPALLRLAEFVAAAVLDPDRRWRLRSWCERVAGRLGISVAALAERRADAEAWAARVPAPVTQVIVRLHRAGAADPDRFLCELWLGHKDGGRTAVATPEGPMEPGEIGRLIRQTADGSEPASGHAPTRVDVVVKADGLDIPVDEWDAGSVLRDLFPDLAEPSTPLGGRYQVTLRCPNLTGSVPTAASEMRRRWAVGGDGTLVVDECPHDITSLHKLLDKPHRDTARVVLHGPPERRQQLLRVCLAMGVPVVLWDRGAGSHEDAPRMDGLDPTGPLDKLPRRLQEFRSQYAASDGAARPALIWEEGELALPGPLRLADPS